jgi:hypothetical protein
MAENAFHPNTADVFLDNFLRIGYTIINSRMGGKSVIASWRTSNKSSAVYSRSFSFCAAGGV